MSKKPELLKLLLDAAKNLGATVSDTAVELTGNRFNSELFSDAISGSSIEREEHSLPENIYSVLIDDIPVLIGELSAPANKNHIEQQMRKYRNQALVARSWLASNAPSLQLFLITPPGAYNQSNWRQTAAEIETDDRICRKLVWLIGDKVDLTEADKFLGRTFIARPWPMNQDKVPLDTVANYTLPTGWEKVADNAELDHTGLVEALIKLEASR